MCVFKTPSNCNTRSFTIHSPSYIFFPMILIWMQVERDNHWIMSKLAPLHYQWQATPVYISYISFIHYSIIWTPEHVTHSFVYNTRPSAPHFSPPITFRTVFLLILAAALVRVSTYVLLWPCIYLQLILTDSFASVNHCTLSSSTINKRHPLPRIHEQSSQGANTLFVFHIMQQCMNTAHFNEQSIIY